MKIQKLFGLILILLTLNVGSAMAQSSGALFEKAFELYTSGDYKTAEALLRRGLQMDADNALGHYYLAELILKRRGSKADAKNHYDRANKISPESKEGLDSLVKSMRLENQIQAEEKQIQDEKADVLRGLRSAVNVLMTIEDREIKRGNEMTINTLSCYRISYSGFRNISEQPFYLYISSRMYPLTANWDTVNGHVSLRLRNLSQGVDLSIYRYRYTYPTPRASDTVDLYPTELNPPGVDRVYKRYPSSSACPY